MSMSWSRELVAADREELDESDRETLKSARGGVELACGCSMATACTSKSRMVGASSSSARLQAEQHLEGGTDYRQVRSTTSGYAQRTANRSLPSPGCRGWKTSPVAEGLRVQWPDGSETVIPDVEANQRLVVR
ncbi:MAG: hypothetical protein OXG61_04375 [Chloroflexi bacterium]|nr:hypothetical protein [Chloroflexota bacterium]